MSSNLGALSAEFLKTLNAWRRSSTYHGYAEVSAYGQKLATWLDEVAAEVQPGVSSFSVQ